jgi:plastocyanin
VDTVRIAFVLIAILTTAACSSGASTTTPTAPTPPVSTPAPPPSPPPAPSGPPTITITAAGMSPLEITIAVGQRVMFVNNDVRAHDVIGGLDPAHPECPEIIQAGFLTPGQQRETAVFTTARTCDYHDHTALGVPAFSGRIIIR